MKKVCAIHLFVMIALFANAFGGPRHRPTFTERDIFQSAYFLKNAPGLITDYHDRPVRYFVDRGALSVFMTDEGLIYRLTTKDEKKAKEMQREHARELKRGATGEEEDDDEGAFIHTYTSYAAVKWLGANPHPRIEPIGKNKGYYTFLAGNTDAELHSIMTDGFRQVVYHDLYPGIDVLYTLPEKGGVKYDLIVHPGADISKVQMQYSGDARKIKVDEKGNIIIHTGAGDLMDHTPSSFTADGRLVASSFQVSGHIISFSLADYDHGQLLTIDPWVAPITQFTGRNVGTDVDYDVAGNLYVYGLTSSVYVNANSWHKVAKYDQSGNFIWIFMGSVASVSWTSGYTGGFNYLSNFKVDKVKNKIYVGKGFDALGCQNIRLDNAGLYDNFITTRNATFRETWSILSDCSTGTILALGGGTNSNLNMGVIDTLTGAVTTSNYTTLPGTSQDIVSGTYDAFGNLYTVMAGPATVSNKVYRVNAVHTGTVWAVASGYVSYQECGNLPSFGSSLTNNFNSLAANSSYLYYYDGFNLKAFNLNTGANVGTATTMAGYTVKNQGGIAVDDCNNIYLGGIGAIKTFTFNGTSFTPGADIPLGGVFNNDTVLDVRYDATINLLYVTGAQMVGTYIATPSINCITISTFSDTVITDCQGASVHVTPGPGLTNPVFSYTWADSAGVTVRQFGPGPRLNDTLNGLSPGRYTVQIQLNINCGGGLFVDSFTIIDCHALTVSPDTTICPGGAAVLSATGQPPGGTYLWMPGGAATSSISVSPAVSTTYVVTYTPPFGSPSTDSIHVTVIAGTTVTMRDTAICRGGNATLTATPSAPGGTYLWSPGGLGPQSISVSPTVTSQYRVTYTTSTCGAASAIATVSVAQPSAGAFPRAICFGTSTLFHGQNISLAGTYHDTLANAAGCDSIVTMTLTIRPAISTNISRSICNGTSIIFNGQTLTTGGVYRDTLPSVAGCDSIIIMTLTVKPVVTTNISRSICNGKTTVFNGQTISTAGTYRDTLTAITGCDSILILTVTVIPVTSTNISRSICNGKITVFNGQTISTAGTYRDTLTAVTGCDSILILTVTVLPTSLTNISRSICSGTTTVFGGRTLSTAGTYRDTLLKVTGCDSIIVLSLTVIPIVSTNISRSICRGTSTVFNGQTISVAGTYRDTLSAVTGCDSIIIMTLTLLPIPTTSISRSICNGTSTFFHRQNISIGGIYRDTLSAVTGCDSIITLTLTVMSIRTTNISRSICNGTSTFFHGQNILVAGVYRDTIPAVTGCDSILILTVTVRPKALTNLSRSICNGKTTVFNGQTISTAGVYRDTLSTVLGCDSILVLTVTVLPTSLTNISRSICSGTTTVFGGRTLSTAGTYRDTLPKVTGCDSIIVLSLTVTPIISTNISRSICRGTSTVFNGQTISIAGSYRDTLSAVTGCDSIIIMTLTLLPIPTTSISRSICNGTSTFFHGQNISIGGIYRDTLSALTGCDSIITMTLIVLPVRTTNLSRSICNGTSTFFHGQNILVAGVYRDTIPAVTGCDSILILTVTVRPTALTNLSRSICNGKTTVFNGQTISTAGVYRDTLPTVLGCDSILVLTVTVLPTSLTNISRSICSGTTTVFGGRTLSAAGTYRDTLPMVSGCDSILVLSLTVISPLYTNLSQSICSGTSTVFDGQTISAAGIYRDTLTAASGCDSIVSFTLTVVPVVYINISRGICPGSSTVFDGQTISAAGVYRDTLPAVTGCDSVVILTVSVLPVPVVNISQTTCPPSIFFHGQIISASGTYRDTLAAANGCDSIIILALTIVPPVYTQLNQTICFGASTVFQGRTLSASGTYRDTLLSAASCDSIITLDLTVLPQPSSATSQSICNGTSIVFYGQSISAAGTYHDTLSAVSGCDSIVTLTLAILPTALTNISQSICHGSTFTFHGRVLSSAGIYRDTLATTDGCDSIVALSLSILVSDTGHIQQSICVGEHIIFNGVEIGTAGIYSDTLTASTGCDSIVRLTLSVQPDPVAGFILHPVGDSLYVGAITVISTAQDANSISWKLNDQVVTLENDSFLPVTASGDYCVRQEVISLLGCADTMQKCFYVLDDAFVMPNAFTPNGDGVNDIFLGSGKGVRSYDLKIFNRWGEIVFESDQLSIGWDGYYRGALQPPGVYVYEVNVSLLNNKTHLYKGSVTLIR
ncbi:MAG: hypothetical protein JWO03_658 [Bacteroidetes bacterium]|nr:hypothetical protein [Bacteroidota bacterium]